MPGLYRTLPRIDLIKLFFLVSFQKYRTIRVNQRITMKNQGLYRGGENKKIKTSKAEKVYNAIQAMKRKALANGPKKETTA